MKQLFLPLLLAATLPLTAQETPNREQLIEALMQAPDETSLTAAITAGEKAGLPNQMFLEARFIHLINKNDPTALAALAPALQKQLPHYSPDDTLIFGVKEDFESIIYYARALAALQKNDTPLFKKLITEAYWLSPAHGTQFAPHITEVRLKEAMAKVTLDLNRTFIDQKQSDKTTTFKQLLGDAPALLLHFWTPWVQPSILAMPEVDALAKKLTENKIPVASLLLAGTAESKKDADLYLAENKTTTTGHWLVDATKSSLASTLRIAAFPTVVLIKNDGTILFNGDPADADLWQELATLNPAITPPTKNPVLTDAPPEKPNPDQKTPE